MKKINIKIENMKIDINIELEDKEIETKIEIVSSNPSITRTSPTAKYFKDRYADLFL